MLAVERRVVRYRAPCVAQILPTLPPQRHGAQTKAIAEGQENLANLRHAGAISGLIRAATSPSESSTRGIVLHNSELVEAFLSILHANRDDFL